MEHDAPTLTALVAGRVAWLASDRASFVTGGCYPLDGGYLAQRPGFVLAFFGPPARARRQRVPIFACSMP